MALKMDAGMDLWAGYGGLLHYGAEPSSNWLLFERGYTYDNSSVDVNGRIISAGVSGESELHPVLITSYGTGERPILTEQIKIFQQDSENVVISQINLQGGLGSTHASNLLIDEITTTGGIGASNGHGLTLRNSEVIDVVGAPTHGRLLGGHRQRNLYEQCGRHFDRRDDI